MHPLQTIMLSIVMTMPTTGGQQPYQPTDPCSAVEGVQRAAEGSPDSPKMFQSAASTLSACANTMEEKDQQRCLMTIESASDYGAAATLAEGLHEPAYAVQMYLSAYGHFHVAKEICEGKMDEVVDRGLVLSEAGIARTGPDFGIGTYKPRPSTSPTPAPESPSAL